MDNFVDYYALLHVRATAPAAVIKASYRAMMQKLKNHPDFGGDVSFAQQLNSAINVLCNPQARASYDEVRTNHLATQQARSAPADSKPGAKSDRQPDWGEPGGSPAGVNPRKPDQELPFTQNGDGNHAPASSSASTRYTHALPTRNQCPFCHASNSAAYHDEKEGYADSHRCRTCNGATTLVKPIALNSSDQLRKIHRQLHETVANVWIEWPSETSIASRLTDFSPTGCALQIMQPLAVGDCIMIDTQLFNAICRVCHCRQPTANDSCTVGVEFLTLDIVALRGSLLNASV